MLVFPSIISRCRKPYGPLDNRRTSSAKKPSPLQAIPAMIMHSFLLSCHFVKCFSCPIQCIKNPSPLNSSCISGRSIIFMWERWSSHDKMNDATCALASKYCVFCCNQVDRLEKGCCVLVCQNISWRLLSGIYNNCEWITLVYILIAYPRS